MKDALTLGAELKVEEQVKKQYRISRALKGDTGISSREQTDIAGWFYEARWSGRRYDENPSQEEVLEDFCALVFGCTFDEMMKAYDNYLG